MAKIQVGGGGSTGGSGPLGPLIHLSRPVAAVAAGDDGFADWTGATVDAPLVVNDYNLELPADQVWSIQVQAYPDASEATGQFLATIAWNADGQELYGTRASLDSDTFFDFSTASLLRATGDDLSNRTVTFKVWNFGAVAHDFSLDVYLQRLA